MSRVVIPRAYIEMMRSSSPSNRVWCFATSFGSKSPLRSRGIWTLTEPLVIFSVFALEPLREFPVPLPSLAFFL
jgi:hypothetical protein